MNKEQFILALYDELKGIPIDDVEKTINYYREMIDERMEDGMSEEEAVAAMGSIQDIAEQILAETPLTTLVRDKVTGGKPLPTWEIVLLVLGAPLWIPLGAAAFSILLAVYIVIWSMVIALGAVTFALAVSGIACIIGCVPLMLRMGVAYMLFSLGGGLVCTGIAVLLFFVLRATVIGVAKLSRSIWLGIKSIFVRKEAA
ncbi:MAG: DUF1700 domain-containing protein [Oscillospiraceae bacterium]|nr:DUF1700 domain-containing protein [Oscillospiraceae bacterium]